MKNEVKIGLEVREIHTKVDHLVALVEKQNERVTKLEENVGSIRRWQAFVVGVFTAAGTGIGTIIGRFTG
jgi:hypothetical protein